MLHLRSQCSGHSAWRKEGKSGTFFPSKGTSQTLNWGASFLRDAELQSPGMGQDLEQDVVCKSQLTGEQEWSKGRGNLPKDTNVVSGRSGIKKNPRVSFSALSFTYLWNKLKADKIPLLLSLVLSQCLLRKNQQSPILHLGQVHLTQHVSTGEFYTKLYASLMSSWIMILQMVDPSTSIAALLPTPRVASSVRKRRS